MEHRGGESRGWGGTSPATVRDAMLVMLSLAAGCVDAVGYLGLGQIFVANMTGNTVLLGLALGQAQGQAALRALVVLAAFAVGWFLVEADPAGLAVYPLIALPSLAMGVQSAAVRRLGIPGVATTYITGTLTDLTGGAIARLRPAVYAAVYDGERSGQGRPSARGLLLPADVWLAYGAGAVIVGIMAVRWPSGVLSVPVTVLALVVVTAVARFRDQGDGR